MTQLVDAEMFKNGVNVALGGGGAKGFVHLGVLEELAELGVEIKAIVGTSIGAIIGALFAHFSTKLFQGRQDAQLVAAKAVPEVFLSENFWQYADLNLFSGLRRGIFGGQKITDWLAKKLNDPNIGGPISFRDLHFPLTVTATDAHTGESLILNSQREGTMSVHLAVRASMSIQWVFREITLDAGGTPHLCWDGGTTGNCRFDIANRLYEGRPTVASSLTYRGETVTTQSGLYLARAARNRWIDRWRQREVVQRNQEEFIRALEQPMTPEASLTKSDLNARLGDAVAALASPYRDLLEALLKEDTTLAELARRHGIKRGTIYTQFRRGLDLLRVEWDRRNAAISSKSETTKMR